MDSTQEAFIHQFLFRRQFPLYIPNIYPPVLSNDNNVDELPTDLSCTRQEPLFHHQTTTITTQYQTTKQRRKDITTTRKQDSIPDKINTAFTGAQQQHGTAVVPAPATASWWGPNGTTEPLQACNNTGLLDFCFVTTGVPAPPGSMMSTASSVAAAPSPFRSPGGGGGAGLLRTAPWPPTAHAPEGFGRFAVGGNVFSLFPSVPNATEASAIYSQASSSPGGRFGGQTATFHSFLGAQKSGETLFSAGFPLTPNSMPPNSPQQLYSTMQTMDTSERGISQLEMMARGLQQDKTAERRPTRVKEKRIKQKQNVKESKPERSTCGCRPNTGLSTGISSTCPASNIQQQQQQHLRIGDLPAATAFHPPSPKTTDNERIYHEQNNNIGGGCSRTTPLPPRSRSSETFTPINIKKEAGSTTPCQVAEITTSRGIIPPTSNDCTPPVANHGTKVALGVPTSYPVIKTEPPSSMESNDFLRNIELSSQHQQFPANNGKAVGIAVGRQRDEPNKQRTTTPIAPAPEKSADNFRVLLPASSRVRQPTAVSTCVLTTPTVTAAIHEQRTATLTIPASSIVLQTSPSTAAVASTTTSLHSAAATATTLQVQHHQGGTTVTPCDETTALTLAARLTNNIVPPWTSHNSALTPPTLWLGQPQYPTGPTVQLETTQPPPPVGLQLIRDPVSGHLLLLPAASLEHIQRTVQVWPSTTSAFATNPTPQHAVPQLMLHQSTPQPAPAPQHITLFPSQPQGTTNAPEQAEFRILLPPQHAGTQLALQLHEAVKPKKPVEIEPPKLEILDTMAKLMPADPQGATTSFPTASFVFPQSAPQQPPLQYFYEQVQVTSQQAQLTTSAPLPPPPPPPQPPTTTITNETGRRSQGTSPANPAEGCLTPPPETITPPETTTTIIPERPPSVPIQPEVIEPTVDSTEITTACEESNENNIIANEPAVSVQDASNQTETPPVSEDETTHDEEAIEQIPTPESPTPPPPPPPVDVSGLELLSNSIEQFTQREKEQQQHQQNTTAAPVTEMIGGLGLLCALAEQRFMEDIVENKEGEEEEKNEEVSSPQQKTERIDINRNYKSPKSEREIKKFIASKVSQYQQEQTGQNLSAELQTPDMMDAMELEMRMRLAELQRRYKEKQKELSKLQQPRRTSDDGSNSPGKRGPGRPRKRKLSPNCRSPRPKKERSPPLLEKEEEKVQKSTKDILKPPTLTKILTSPRLKPCKFKPPTCNKRLPTKQVEEKTPSSSHESISTSSWLAGSFSSSFRSRTTSSTRKLSPLSTATTTSQPASLLTGYTFGSKQLTPSLLSGGEKQRLQSLASDSMLWLVKPGVRDETQNKNGGSSPTNNTSHQFGALPGQKRKAAVSEGESDHEATPSLFSMAVASSSSSCSSCSSSSSSSSKKRKPGRPKRRAPSRQDETLTETIVAKKPKSISFLLSPPSPPMSMHKPSKIKPKLKAEAKVKSTLDDEEDQWPQKIRTESSSETKSSAWNALEVNGNERPRMGLDAATRLGTKAKKPLVNKPKQRTGSNDSRKKSHDEKPEPKQPKHKVATTGSTSLTLADLEDETRALVVMGGLVYAGHVTAIRAPDVYGITLDGERGNRPHIFSREELLKEAIREVKPSSPSEVPVGTRVCAFWSQQYRCLYPGTVAEPTSPDPSTDQSFVNVEFDDGDSGRINIEDVRLLPTEFPIVEYDPNPLLSLAKRRRRASGASSTEGRLASTETPVHDEIVLSPLPPQVQEAPANAENKVADASRDEDEEERERRRQRKRERARKKEKFRKLLARGVAALGKLPGHKKHKKRRCEDRHHHKHHHKRRKHRHHRHGDKCKSSAETSSTPSSSSPAPDVIEPKPEVKKPEKIAEVKPEPPKPEPKVVEAKPEPKAETTKKMKLNEAKAKKRQERQSSGESRSKMAAFLPARQLWRWAGRGYKRPGAKGRGKKEFFKCIQRGKETINVGDCAVFLSTGRPDRPYIGRIETMWESWGGNMVVRVKWFYHPEETQGGENLDKLKFPGALFQSPHADENDVQTISHRCEVLALSEYTKRLGKEPARYSTIYDNNDIYYLAGNYDPTAGVLTMEQGVINP